MTEALTPDELTALEMTTLARVNAGFASRRITYRGSMDGSEAVCDLHVFVNMPERSAAAVLTEREDNPGRSVANAIELLAEQVYRDHLAELVPPERVAWIQRDRALVSRRYGYERVRLSWQPHGRAVRFHTPTWQPLSASKLAKETA